MVISPIIGRSPLSGPAHKYMEAEDFEVSPIGVFKYYENIGTHFMFDCSDEDDFKEALKSLASKNQKKILFEEIIIPTKEKQEKLAKKIFETEFY